MVRVTETDVYHTLSYHVWKSGLEIKKELRTMKGITDHLDTLEGKSTLRILYEILFKDRDLDPGMVYIHLHHLEEQGFAEDRIRQINPEELRMRSGLPQREYRLTSNGIRNRHKYEGKQVGVLESILKLG